MPCTRASASIVILTLLAACSRDEIGQGPSDDSKIGHASAAATLTLLAGVDDQPMLRGKATFTKTTNGVNLAIELFSCAEKGQYRFRIEDAASCNELKGEPWDGTRGEIEAGAPCYGGAAGAFMWRESEGPRSWRLGGAGRSNVIGRMLVMSDSDSKRTLACGTITAQSSGVGAQSDAGPEEPSLAIRAHIAGMCETKLFVHSGPKDCPAPEQVAQCAEESCELNSCLAACETYTECLKGDSGDWCSSTCERSQACWDCTSSMFGCLFKYCDKVLTCAVPAAPNGPCRKLEACCRMQRKGVDACLDLLARTERWSGDPSCAGLLVDDAFLTDIVNDPRCDELDL